MGYPSDAFDTYDPMFADTFAGLLDAASSAGTLSEVGNSAYYDSTTMAMVTAYYKYSISDTSEDFSDALKFAVVYHTATAVDSRFSSFAQQVIQLYYLLKIQSPPPLSLFSTQFK
jgi:hypothetical protein